MIPDRTASALVWLLIAAMCLVFFLAGALWSPHQRAGPQPPPEVESNLAPGPESGTVQRAQNREVSLHLAVESAGGQVSLHLAAADVVAGSSEFGVLGSEPPPLCADGPVRVSPGARGDGPFLGPPPSALGTRNSRLGALLAAIRRLESVGNDRAVGDGGRSRGPYQIQLAYWIDGGGDSSCYLTNVWDPRACERVMVGYWRRYCPTALARLDVQTLARVHNGGPAGAGRSATLDYWRRVKAAMGGGA